jgi:hypothetical protein
LLWLHVFSTLRYVLAFILLVAPFYSFVRGIAVEDMWHNDDDCQIGQSVAPADRLAGKNHILKHCWLCASLNPVRPALPTPTKKAKLTDGTRFVPGKHRT